MHYPIPYNTLLFPSLEMCWTEPRTKPRPFASPSPSRPCSYFVEGDDLQTHGCLVLSSTLLVDNKLSCLDVWWIFYSVSLGCFPLPRLWLKIPRHWCPWHTDHVTLQRKKQHGWEKCVSYNSNNHNKKPSGFVQQSERVTVQDRGYKLILYVSAASSTMSWQ